MSLFTIYSLISISIGRRESVLFVDRKVLVSSFPKVVTHLVANFENLGFLLSVLVGYSLSYRGKKRFWGSGLSLFSVMSRWGLRFLVMV